LNEIQGLRFILVALHLYEIENLSRDKHVESKFVPRLDESSNLSRSTALNYLTGASGAFPGLGASPSL